MPDNDRYEQMWRRSQEMHDELHRLDYNQCDVCGGLGEVLVNNTFRPCPNPDCEAGQRSRDALVERMTRLSRIPAEYHSARLDDFLTLSAKQQAGKDRAYHAALMYAEQQRVWPGKLTDHAEWQDAPPRRWLMLWGDYGTGKTHLACSIILAINASGQPARYTRVDDFLREIRATYDHLSDDTTDTVLERYQDVPVLLLDEMNLTRTSEHTLTVMEQLIRYRYGNDLPTIFTTNSDQNTFVEQWGGRIASVVMDKALWVRMAGPSLRSHKGSIG